MFVESKSVSFLLPFSNNAKRNFNTFHRSFCFFSHIDRYIYLVSGRLPALSWRDQGVGPKLRGFGEGSGVSICRLRSALE